jgi:ABC-type bacteriocin/lantibiotic exporter with double-glycine peptidase domain
MLQWAKPALACLCFTGLLWGGESGVWLDVPFVGQGKNGCGAASITMIIRYWQRQQHQTADGEAKQIQQTLYSRRAHGIYATDLKRYLDDHGYKTFVFQGEWTDLKEHLKKGRPLVVALKPRGQGELHYVVVAGLDWAQDFVAINDPGERKLLKQTRFEFEKAWKATDNWTLLAIPREQNNTPSSH